MSSSSESSQTMDDRKLRKPIMEKKRRARINESLESLKQILLECDPETTRRKQGLRTNKLEKADILELTVKYLQNIKPKVQQSQNYNYYPSHGGAYSSRGGSSNVYVPKNHTGGGQVFFGASHNASRQAYQQNNRVNEKIWRPW